MTVTIYHNPRCSKSRQTLALLQEQGIEPEIVEYLKVPLNMGILSSLRKKLGGDAYIMLRPKEAEYKQAGLSKESTPEEILRVITEHPKLLERPIVVKGDKAAIGRPPESVLDIL